MFNLHTVSQDTDSRANFSLSVILPDGDVFLQGALAFSRTVEDPILE
jgi:hypothetical protein